MTQKLATLEYGTPRVVQMRNILPIEKDFTPISENSLRYVTSKAARFNVPIIDSASPIQLITYGPWRHWLMEQDLDEGLPELSDPDMAYVLLSGASHLAYYQDALTQNRSRPGNRRVNNTAAVKIAPLRMCEENIAAIASSPRFKLNLIEAAGGLLAARAEGICTMGDFTAKAFYAYYK